MQLKQISVFLENKSGRLSRVTQILKEADIDILAMPVTTIWIPTQKVKNATILLMTMLPLSPIFRMIFCPCVRNR